MNTKTSLALVILLMQVKAASAETLPPIALECVGSSAEQVELFPGEVEEVKHDVVRYYELSLNHVIEHRGTFVVETTKEMLESTDQNDHSVKYSFTPIRIQFHSKWKNVGEYMFKIDRQTGEWLVIEHNNRDVLNPVSSDIVIRGYCKLWDRRPKL